MGDDDLESIASLIEPDLSTVSLQCMTNSVTSAISIPDPDPLAEELRLSMEFEVKIRDELLSQREAIVEIRDRYASMKRNGRGPLRGASPSMHKNIRTKKVSFPER